MFHRPARNFGYDNVHDHSDSGSLNDQSDKTCLEGNTHAYLVPFLTEIDIFERYRQEGSGEEAKVWDMKH